MRVTVFAETQVRARPAVDVPSRKAPRHRRAGVRVASDRDDLSAVTFALDGANYEIDLREEMAQKVPVQFVDDLDGGIREDISTVSFALDGTNYEIDLPCRGRYGPESHRGTRSILSSDRSIW